jgi:hypothetical protein
LRKCNTRDTVPGIVQAQLPLDILKIHMITRDDLVVADLVITLNRTDTTLDQSQKAKRYLKKTNIFSFTVPRYK